MKKIIVAVVAVVLVLGIGATSAFAIGFGPHHSTGTNSLCAVAQTTSDTTTTLNNTCAQTDTCKNYVDANGDGVCDHCICQNNATTSSNNNVSNSKSSQVSSNTTSTHHYGHGTHDGTCDGSQHRCGRI